MKIQKLFSRGLNYHGQCGLGNAIVHTHEKFIEVPNIPKHIHSLHTGLAHNALLLSDLKTIYYFGFIWDIRTFLRTANYLQGFPSIMKFLKNTYPTLKYFPSVPTAFKTLENQIKKIEFGGNHMLVLDSTGVCFGMGNNMQGQLGDNVADIRPKLHQINTLDQNIFTNIAAGFQHSVFTNDKGEIFGCGKHDKNQLGQKYLDKYNLKYSFSELICKLENLEINLTGEKVIDIGCGKYHTLFLTDKGNVYSLGVNRFGQLGKSNLTTFNTGELIKIEFPDKDLKIKEIRVGDNHNLMLTEAGDLYGNGDNSSGQVDGDLERFIEYDCTPKKIELPGNSKIKKFYAKNNRSAAIMEDGLAYYWGGYCYSPLYTLSKQPKYNGINVFNEEEGISKNLEIKDIGLGYLHDLILGEE